MKAQPIYPPVYSQNSAGVALVVLTFGLLSLAFANGIADQVFGWTFLVFGGYFVVGSWRERSIREKAYLNGVDVEARIVSPRQPPFGKLNGVPAFGVAYCPLKVEYEVDGQRIVSQQDVPESFLVALQGKTTLKISVHPERPSVWVPVG